METKNNATPNKGGRTTTAERQQKLNAFSYYRSIGKSQKETARLISVTEKTAGRYERLRLKRLQQPAELIKLLTAKANEPTTTAKDLVYLTKEIDRLSDKLNKSGNLF